MSFEVDVVRRLEDAEVRLAFRSEGGGAAGAPQGLCGEQGLQGDDRAHQPCLTSPQ